MSGRAGEVATFIIPAAGDDDDDGGNGERRDRRRCRTPDGSNNSNLRRGELEDGKRLHQRKTAKLLCVCHEAVSSSLMLRDVASPSLPHSLSLLHLCHVPCNCTQCLSFTFPLSGFHSRFYFMGNGRRPPVVECGRPSKSMDGRRLLVHRSGGCDEFLSRSRKHRQAPFSFH